MPARVQGGRYKSSPHAKAKERKTSLAWKAVPNGNKGSDAFWVETDRSAQGAGGCTPLSARPRAGAAAAALCAYAKALCVYFNALLLLKIQIDMLKRRHLAHVAGDARVVV